MIAIRSPIVIASTWSWVTVDEGRLEVVVQLLELDPGLPAELGVEVRERFVEEEHLGIADDRPAQRDALALAA